MPRNTIEFCLAVRNKASGFYSNHHINGSNWYNNPAYRNGNNYNMLNRLKDNVTDVPGYAHKMRNNIGYKGGKELINIDSSQCDLANNYLNLGLEASNKDFLSVDESLLTATRLPNGSLPNVAFMKLSPNSKFIDKGQDIGSPFKGKAPDLGAFESGK